MTMTARAKWRWAALLLQAEALGLLIFEALRLITATESISPVPALLTLVGVALLLPLGSALERGSHAAGLILIGLYAVHIMSAITAARHVLALMLPLLVLEGLVFGRAVVAMSRTPAESASPDARSRAMEWLKTCAPIVVAFGLMSRVQQDYQRALSSYDPVQVRTVADRTGVALLLLGLVTAFVHGFPNRAAFALTGRAFAIEKLWARRPLRNLPPVVWVDFTVAVILLASSLYVLLTTLEAMSRPSVMLVPGVLLIPLFAIAYFGLGVIWIGIGIAELRRKSWTMKARIAAALPVAWAAILILPGLLKALAEQSLSQLR